ncbi:hypothetical protein [Paenibacillus lutrae]|uniref:hypothetical protein n=1 Tax=Paenibacillus lutrae TaxID=2078573 RepID=UPI001F33ABA1|nr:hypothetical protein [Paenibacillus lutrae]
MDVNMQVGAARQAAEEWVLKHAAREAGFKGAYYSGSTVGLPDDAVLPPASDMDVMIVTNQAEPPVKLGKFLYGGALLEITYVSSNELSSAE